MAQNVLMYSSYYVFNAPVFSLASYVRIYVPYVIN